MTAKETIQKFYFFSEFPRDSTGDQPLAKELGDSRYEIGDVAGVIDFRHPFTQEDPSLNS